MDINKQWQILEQANFNQKTIKKEEIMKAIQQESSSTIAELKKRLGQKINWAILFIILFIGIALYYYDNTGIILIMGMATTIYLAGYFMMSKEYRKLKAPEYSSNSILDGLKSNLKAIKSAINKERIFGLCAFPIMLIVGLAFIPLKKGINISQVLQNEYSLGKVIIILLSLLVMGLIAEKMNKIAFGEHIKRLEDQIKSIEQLS